MHLELRDMESVSVRPSPQLRAAREETRFEPKFGSNDGGDQDADPATALQGVQASRSIGQIYPIIHMICRVPSRSSVIL